MIKFDEQDFLSRYRGMSKFVTEEAVYYKAFLKLLENDELLANIKFSNDELEIPPIKTFITYERNRGNSIFEKEMTPVAKRGLGACFGYLYRFIYQGYEPEQTWVNDDKTSIKTASYFIKK